MPFKPPKEPKPFIGSKTLLEEWAVAKNGYAIKRLRYDNDDDDNKQGCVIVYKYNQDNVGLVLQKYNTCNHVDKKLYDALLSTLETGYDFEYDFKRMLITDDVRPYIKLEKEE